MICREVARELGLISGEDIERAKTAPAVKGENGALLLPDEARVASAEKRVRRNEKLLAACEGRIRAAGLLPPAWLAG